MKIKQFWRSTIIVGLLFSSIPVTSYAYEVTDAKVTRLSDTVTMYTLSYEFGFLNADLWMPFHAARKADAGVVGYESAATKSSAVVLSDARVTDDKMYYVPKGERVTFKLVVLEEQVGPATKEVKRVRVTTLPFITQKEGKEKVKGQLRDVELEPFIVWNK